MPKGTILCYHGWAFDSACWTPWLEALGSNFDVRLFEAGYFQKEGNEPEFFISHGEKIVIAHSFGLHQCKDKLLAQADILVLFGGFLEFHPHAAQFRRRSKLVLQKMISEFQTSPQSVLQKFYQNVYLPSSPPEKDFSALNKNRLLDDLVRLHQQKIEVEKLKKVDKICILHGSDDAIVPRRKGRELHDNFWSKSKYFEIKKAGHALPFTHFEQCISLLEPELT